MKEVTFKTERCKGCGYCIEQCPKHVLQWSGESNQAGYPYPVQAKDGCISCGICYRVCPDCVITVYQ